MGYSIRTPPHRYTRRVKWSGREPLAEELYHYSSDRSAVRQGAFLVKRGNIVGDPDYRELRDRLATMLDQSLNTRTSLQETTSQAVEKAADKKRRRGR